MRQDLERAEHWIEDELEWAADKIEEEVEHWGWTVFRVVASIVVFYLVIVLWGVVF